MPSPRKKPGQKNDLFKKLSHIAEGILVNEDFSQTSANILSNLRKHLDVYGCGILFPDDSNQFLSLYSYSKTKAIDFFIRYVRPTVFNQKFPIDSETLLVSRCFKENKITQSQHIRDFVSPIIPGTAMDFIGKVAKLKLCMAIPIRVMGKPTGVIFAVFRRDITKAELDLFQFYANLSGLALDNHMKLNQMKRQFEMEKTTTSVLSHELKTPIAIAHHSAQMLLFSLEKAAGELSAGRHRELSERALEVQSDLNRILRICNSIFSLREVEAFVPLDTHVLDLHTQLNAIVENFQRLAVKRGLVLNATIEDAEHSYKGGIVQLEQIITILLDNAIKYTRSGTVDLHVKIAAGKLTTIVTDTGEGIPEKERPKIFEQYYRRHQGLSKKPEGLGLGLYIAKKIVDKMDGKITVASNPSGRGSEFRVEIPVYLSK